MPLTSKEKNKNIRRMLHGFLILMVLVFVTPVLALEFFINPSNYVQYEDEELGFSFLHEERYEIEKWFDEKSYNDKGLERVTHGRMLDRSWGCQSNSDPLPCYFKRPSFGFFLSYSCDVSESDPDQIIMKEVLFCKGNFTSAGTICEVSEKKALETKNGVLGELLTFRFFGPDSEGKPYVFDGETQYQYFDVARFDVTKNFEGVKYAQLFFVTLQNIETMKYFNKTIKSVKIVPTQVNLCN